MNRSNIGNVVTNGVQTTNILATNAFDRINNAIRRKRNLGDASQALNNKKADFNEARRQFELEQNRQAAVGTKEYPYDKPTYQSAQTDSVHGGFGGYIDGGNLGISSNEIDINSEQADAINQYIESSMKWIEKRTQQQITNNPIRLLIEGGSKNANV